MTMTDQKKGMMSEDQALQLVHSAIVKVLDGDDNIDAVFGSPVDTSLLPDYNTIIEYPRDLGTIAKSIEESLDGRGPYVTYGEALADVQLVWKNCLRYNDRPEDTEIVSLCHRGRSKFKEALKDACAASGIRLADAPVRALLDQPMRFSEEGKGDELPQKDIDDFEVVSADSGEAINLLSLGETRISNESALISGILVAGKTGASKQGRRVSNEPVLDWAIDRSIDSVEILVITKGAWYRLQRPSKKYEGAYRHILEAVEIIEAAIDLAELQEEVDIQFAVSEAIKKKRGKRKLSALVKNFILSHLEALYGGEKDSSHSSQDLDEDPNYEAISDDDMPEDFDLDDDDFDYEEYDVEEFEEVRKKAWRREKYNAQKKIKQQLVDAKTLEAEIEGHEKRGSAPEMYTSLRLPPNKVHEVLFLWSFLQEFGDILRIAPFSFRTLEAALCPGPSIAVTIQDHAESIKDQDKKTIEPQNKLPEQGMAKNDEPKEEHIDQNDVSVVEKEEDGQNLENDLKIKDEKTVGEITGSGDRNTESGDLDSSQHVPLSVEAQATELPRNAPPSVEADQDQPNSIDDHNPEKIKPPVEDPPVKVKRGRGRPRKDGSAPQPRPFVGLPKVAPQNIVLDPTVRTRRQRGVTVTSKILDEYALDIDEILKDDEYRLPKQRKKMVKPKSHIELLRPSNVPNKISEAIRNTQKIQEEYEANLKRKYGITSDVLKYGAPVDKHYAPSGILLRDIVLALLGVIDDTLPPIKSDYKRPLSASTFLPPRYQKSLWPEAAANNVWSWDGVWEEAKDAALHLAYGDFVDLTVDQKVELLSGLLYEAIESKYISGELSKRADKCLQQQASRATINCSKQYGRDLAQHILSEMAKDNVDGDASTTSGGSLKDWARWLDVLGLGTKACIGEDFTGRRYWALGQESGAFRVFCQEIKCEDGTERDVWGWYEGYKLTALLDWLRSADIRSERPLIAALSTAPYPTDLTSSKVWKNSDFENQRADGYRNISQPLLKGEWNHCNGKPLPLGAERRVSQAIETIMGSISFWFKDDELSKKLFAISDILVTMQPKASARALLVAEKLLSDAGKVTEEWVDIWGPKWKPSVTSILDVRDIALHIASLQSHVIMQADVIPRGTYMKILDDLNCTLAVPLPSDNITVMKTGILQHIDKSIELLGLAEDDTEGGGELNPDAEMTTASDMAILPLKKSSRSFVRSNWMKLREDVCSMKYIEQYIVRGITYRKHLVDSEHVDAEGYTKEEAALLRKPVAWLYLKPVEYSMAPYLASRCMVVPIVLHKGLENYFTLVDDFKKRMSVDWCNNDRFKLFIPPTPAQRRSKNVGFWKKGTVVENLLEQNPDRDPWESVVIEFDNTPVGETTRVSPWKLEIDPEEEKAMVEEARKMEQAVARSQRARSSSRSDNPEEAKVQEAEWTEEDNQLLVTLKQAKRSEHLLRIHDSQSHHIPGEVHNTLFYGADNKAKYYDYLSDLGNDLFMKYFALASKARSKGDGRSVNNAFPSGPLIPGQQIDPKILDALRLLTRDQFMLMLRNFYVGLKGRFKIPIFAHKELDLFVVWWSVIERFGYETVTAHKQWKDICRALNLNLSGQTSASFNMRLNYERCLLDFENYLACGQYELDLASNKAPAHTHVMDPSTTRFFIPGAYEDQIEYLETPLVSSLPSEDDAAREPEATTSMQPEEKDDKADGATAKPSTKISLKGALSKPKVNKPDQIIGVPGETLGSHIKSIGSAAIGLCIELLWPTEGGWWPAEIVNFDTTNEHHQVLYNKGLPDESFEWIDMAKLGPEELRQFDQKK